MTDVIKFEKNAKRMDRIVELENDRDRWKDRAFELEAALEALFSYALQLEILVYPPNVKDEHEAIAQARLALSHTKEGEG